MLASVTAEALDSKPVASYFRCTACSQKLLVELARIFNVRIWTFSTHNPSRYHDFERFWIEYSRVSFYDDSLLRLLSSRTEPSWLAVRHCHNSSVLSLLSALLALFRCACVSSFSILVHFFWVGCDFSTHDVHQKVRKEEKINTVDVTFFLYGFWATAWAFFRKIGSDLIDIFFNHLLFPVYIIH